MQLGMIGLGRMGRNMVQRLLRAGHACVVTDRNPGPAAELAREGATAAASLPELLQRLAPPRAVWIMVPVNAVQGVVDELAPLLQPGDCIIDGGNSPFEHAIRRSGELGPRGIDYIDVGTSGGVWGLERGYCLMIGGPVAVVRRLEPLFRALAPGRGEVVPAAPPAAGSTASEGYLHCGPSGAGHFVKMVHNGIEYGMMAAYAEGFNLFRHANAGTGDALPDNAARYRYDLDLPAIAELWRRGSVVSSWLLDLTAAALAADPKLAGFHGRVADSGEGRWTLKAAIDTATPVPVLSAALYSRFDSRGESDFANRLLSAMRQQFGGHREPGQ
ncbi:MAG: decarboxylating 6-phosphogluconate dehydrogenase [Gammaproteobacteria bacterium]|nr:MAG: decarboxylating 6-phosphogluconate dehydrogenase [Gammaproteobacteria bacterium]